MGYGLPSAIGAKVAAPEKIVVDVDGDASFSMTAMELATASQYNIGVKVLILNNEFQGMVLQWQGEDATSGKTFSHETDFSWLIAYRSLLREAILAHSDDQPRLCRSRQVNARPRDSL